MAKKSIMKVLCCVLALVMMLSVFAGCNNEKPVETKPQENKPAETKPGETTPAETTPAEREHVELVWYTFNGKLTVGMEETMEAVNAYLKEKLNTTIEWHFYKNSEYNESVTTIFNSGADIDCLISGASRISFNQTAARGGFLALNDYIDQYLPGTKAQLPQTAWDAYSKEGNIYAVPPIKDLATNFCFVFNSSLAEDLGVAVPETFATYDELIPYLYQIKAARDAKYPEKADQPVLDGGIEFFEAWYFMEPFIGSNGSKNVLLAANIPGQKGIAGMGQGETVYCPFYSNEYLEFCKTMRQLVVDGIIPFDAATFDEDKVIADAGELIGTMNIGLLYLDENDNPNYKSKLVTSDVAYLTTGGMQSGGFAIPAQSKNVERTLEVVELLNTDTYLATMIRFGPEGIGWTDTDNDGVIELTPQNSDPSNRYWYAWYGWNLGAFPVSKVIPGVPANYGEMVNKLNQNAVPGGNLGFVFDQEPVSNEIAACNNVLSEYHKVLITGQNDNVEELVNDFVAKLKASGMDRIVEECQNQLNAWRAANGK